MIADRNGEGTPEEMNRAIAVIGCRLGVSRDKRHSPRVVAARRLIRVTYLDRRSIRSIQGSALAIPEVHGPGGHGPVLDGHAQVEIQVLRQEAAEGGRDNAWRPGHRDRG